MAEWFEKKTLGTLLDEAALRGIQGGTVPRGQALELCRALGRGKSCGQGFISVGIQAGDKKPSQKFVV
jgi:hypothetical protein